MLPSKKGLTGIATLPISDPIGSGLSSFYFRQIRLGTYMLLMGYISRV